MQESSTIVARATANGRGALAIIRISGKEAFQIFASCIAEHKKFACAKPWQIGRYTFLIANQAFDDITASKYQNPKSYTGEDMVEIFCHGSHYVTERIIEEIVSKGGEYAKQGEFSRRAFQNGKMDLLRAEAIKGMIDAESEISFEASKNIYWGSGAKKIEQWKERIIEVLSRVESEIEFGEEDDIQQGRASFLHESEKLLKEILGEKEKGVLTEKYVGGIRVAIVGPANAGKSTLFNFLVNEERAIVHELPGTTRDCISERMKIHGKEITLIDCAGIRDTDSTIEKEGIKRSFEELKKAQIVLWVTPNSEHIDNSEIETILDIERSSDKKVLFICSKADLSNDSFNKELIQQNGLKCFSISTKSGQGLQDVINEIGKQIQNLYNACEVPSIIGTTRTKAIIDSIAGSIKTAAENCHSLEIYAEYLRQSLISLDEITGKVTTEEVMNKLFETFCIGK